MTQTPYGTSFQEFIKDDSLRSAHKIVPLLVSLTGARSVVDVGCGTGAWLSVFSQTGVGKILGIDGDYVDRRALLIPADRFIGRDIRRPLDIRERFDLVVSVEVAEHLQEACAAAYVDNLTSLGDMVAFSAAIPNQGGIGQTNSGQSTESTCSRREGTAWWIACGDASGATRQSSAGTAKTCSCTLKKRFFTRTIASGRNTHAARTRFFRSYIPKPSFRCRFRSWSRACLDRFDEDFKGLCAIARGGREGSRLHHLG